MREKWEQMELDTRSALDAALDALALETVSTAQELIARCGEAPPMVRNRHEAYGHAAEWYAKAAHAVTAIKKDAQDLLSNLSHPEKSPMDSVNAIVNSAVDAAGTLIRAAAEMRRVMADLYLVESRDGEPTPMEELAAKNAEGFLEAGEAPEEQDSLADDGDGEMEE